MAHARTARARTARGSKVSNAVESSTASPPVPPVPHGPVRTCVGCRKRAAAADLLRIVVGVADAAGQPLRLRLDPGRSAPGRGAWLHPDPKCTELAERRRAFARALRVPIGSDASAVVAAVTGLVETGRADGPRRSHGVATRSPTEGEKNAMNPR